MTALAVAALLLGAAAIVFALGPRVAANTSVTFDPEAIGPDLQAYIAAGEARHGDLREGLAKRIAWAYPRSRARTPLALVYIHGFSASPRELSPLPETVAGALGANLFLTRLTGHGRSGAAMAEASVEDWMNDVAEALAIGRRLGERVVLMGTSTGAALATLAASDPALAREVAGIVTVSANYGVQAAGSQLLTMPWGRQLAELLIGPTRSFEPANALHERYWTSAYPTRALLPMAALVEAARRAPVEAVTMPALFVYSSADAVIRPDAIAEMAERWGGPVEMHDVGVTGDPMNHVLAGDALSPATTDALAARITRFIESRLAEGVLPSA